MIHDYAILDAFCCISVLEISKEHDGLGRGLNSLTAISSSDLVHCKVTWPRHPLLSVALEF